MACVVHQMTLIGRVRELKITLNELPDVSISFQVCIFSPEFSLYSISRPTFI